MTVNIRPGYQGGHPAYPDSNQIERYGTKETRKGPFPASATAYLLSSLAHKATAEAYTGGSHKDAAIAHDAAAKAHKEAMKKATVRSPYKSHEREAENHGEYAQMHRIKDEDI